MREKVHVQSGTTVRLGTKYYACSEMKNEQINDFSSNEAPEKELL